MVLVKLLLLAVIPFFWQYRVPLLLAIVVVASVGSHMPSRFRHRVVIPWPFSSGCSSFERQIIEKTTIE